MVTQPKDKWPNYGIVPSVNAPSQGHLRKLASLEKKRVPNSEVSSECKRHSRQTYGYQERDQKERLEFLSQLSELSPCSNRLYR